MTNLPQPPKYLSAEARAWWRSVVEEYELTDTDLRLVRLAAEALDRAEQARQVLQRKGLTYADPKRGPRMRPEVVIEKDSRAAFAKLIRQLGLDTHEPATSQTRRKSESYWPRWKKEQHGIS